MAKNPHGWSEPIEVFLPIPDGPKIYHLSLRGPATTQEPTDLDFEFAKKGWDLDAFLRRARSWARTRSAHIAELTISSNRETFFVAVRLFVLNDTTVSLALRDLQEIKSWLNGALVSLSILGPDQADSLLFTGVDVYHIYHGSSTPVVADAA
jgi:hypothetical protein